MSNDIVDDALALSGTTFLITLLDLYKGLTKGLSLSNGKVNSLSCHVTNWYKAYSFREKMPNKLDRKNYQINFSFFLSHSIKNSSPSLNF